ncbi:cytochrome b/b6 domain-containing protein [Candidatus Sulfurimonas baltica]|uniref:Cytochrome b/b6 domain-containing protein n=1 Tax=Candidatus Sulfurimonas baltica TaxID=2740404 RepID=A0A7S7LT22_9BACT|nr:cytochrome b/b6 domain-containing protein [Candidatus Sulfurimonas baltica]QOY51036.1 cytochrome b/b6 domain-containing protein [Candidatus Sulfurimonas baltica]
MTKIYVWSLFTRLFHILLVIAVGVVFVLAEFENLLSYHAIVGYTIGLLFLFRIIWGFMDVRYSKFKDFNFNLKDLIEYMFGLFGEKKEYMGHNPASSWAIVAMIILGLASVVTGVVVYGTQEGMGLLSFLNISLFKDMDFFEDVHELFSNAFMGVIFIHVAGVVIDKLLHKSKAVESMVDGYKYGDEKSLKLTLLQKLFGVLWIASSIFLLIYLLSNPSNVLVADNNRAVNYKVEHKLFYDECVSCHTLYPPNLLPSSSWVKMMDNETTAQ